MVSPMWFGISSEGALPVLGSPTGFRMKSGIVRDKFGFEAGGVLKPARVMSRSAGVWISIVIERPPAMLLSSRHDRIHCGGWTCLEREMIHTWRPAVMCPPGQVRRRRQREVSAASRPGLAFRPLGFTRELQRAQEPTPLGASFRQILAPDLHMMKSRHIPILAARVRRARHLPAESRRNGTTTNIV